MISSKGLHGSFSRSTQFLNTSARRFIRTKLRPSCDRPSSPTRAQ